MSLLEMIQIDKFFGSVQVLCQVSLTIEKGEIHALLGENGAGKSTLMNILTGVCSKDAGEVKFKGNVLEHITINHTEELGIAFVHQELNLFNDLKVYENIFLGKEYANKFRKLNKKRMIEETANLFKQLGVDINPLEQVSKLKASQKQLLEISKALFFNAELLILDEPTTALNNEEIDHLFKIVEDLRQKGTSFIFISHKIPEIFRLADKFSVLRNGKFVASGKISEITPENITRLMVGEKYLAGKVYEKRQYGDVVLEVKKLNGSMFTNVDLQVRKGQIVGLTGLQGSGASEFMQGIFGVEHVSSGSIIIKGRKVHPGFIHRMMNSRVGMLPANRKENSVIPNMNILENTYLAEHTLSAWKFHIRRKKEEEKYQRYKNILNIKAQKSSDSISSLSGGNQQKVFITRWLDTEAEILLLDNPTQGIDVGAKAEIYQLILELAKSGKTILINTLEIPELQKVADVCAVFYDGRLVKILDHEEIDETTIMLYSTNAVEMKESINGE